MERPVPNFRPSVCFEVEKVIGVSIGDGNVKTYQVQWAPTWVSGVNLMGCDHLIEEFLKGQREQRQQIQEQAHQKQKRQQQHQKQRKQKPPIMDHDPTILNPHEPNEVLSSAHNFRERPSMLLHHRKNQLVVTSQHKEASMKVVDESIEKIDVIKSEPAMEESDFSSKNEDISEKPSYSYDIDQFVDSQTQETTRDSSNRSHDDVVDYQGEEVLVVQPNPIHMDTNLSTAKTLSDNGGPAYQTTDNIYVSMEYSDMDKGPPSRSPLHPATNAEVISPTATNELHVCPECGKTFAHRSAMIRHRHLHTGDKSFNCAECHKSFSRKDTLTRHFRQHTGEKPYKCGECGKAFTDNSSYRVHMIKFHGAAKYET